MRFWVIIMSSQVFVTIFEMKISDEARLLVTSFRDDVIKIGVFQRIFRTLTENCAVTAIFDV